MNSEIRMFVSSMTRSGDKKGIYVLFTDGDKSAEFCIPDMRLVKNAGFSKEEIKSLLEYMENEQEYIYSVAKNVNPLNGFLGKEQGVTKD